MLWLFGQIWVWLALAFALGAALTAGVLTMGGGRLETAGVRTALAARSRSARHALATRTRRIRDRDTGESTPPSEDTAADITPDTGGTDPATASRSLPADGLDDRLDDRLARHDEGASGDRRDDGRAGEDDLDGGPPTVRYGAYAYDTLPYDGRPYVDAVGLDADLVGTGTRARTDVADTALVETALPGPTVADTGDDGPCDVGHREGTLPMPVAAVDAWPDGQDVPSARAGDDR